jgi:hypothetical protein
MERLRRSAALLAASALRSRRPWSTTARKVVIGDVPDGVQLDVLRVQATATSNQGAKQSPEREIEKREDHATDPPSPRRERRDTSIGALHELARSTSGRSARHRVFEHRYSCLRSSAHGRARRDGDVDHALPAHPGDATERLQPLQRVLKRLRLCA